MGILSISVKIILLITIIIDCGLFIFIFLNRQRGLVYHLLLIHILGILGWTISIMIILQYSNVLAAKLTFVFALILAVSKLWFVKVFPENILPKQILSYLLLLFVWFAIVISFIDGALFQKIRVIDGYYIDVANGQYSAFYSILLVYLFIYPLFILFKKYKWGNYSSIIKIQLKYLFIGLTISFIITLLTNSILPVFFNIYFFNGLGPVFSLVLVGFIIYIITHHQFLDIKVVIQRGLIYTSLLVLIVGFYLALISSFGYIFQKTTHIAVLLSAGLTTIIGIFGVPLIERYFRRITDKIFFKGKYDYSQAMRQLSEALREEVELKNLTDNISDNLKQILRTDIIEFSFFRKEERIGKNNETQIMDNSTRIIVPIILKNEIVGNMLIGKKLSGDSYTDEDIRLLETFSFQAAVALERVRLYEEVKKHAIELEEKVKKRTFQIQKLQEEQKQMMIDISHGLQNPLTVMKNEMYHLKDSASDIHNFNVCEKSIDEISKFIYDLLKLAKLESDTESFKKESINLSALFDELIEYFDVIATEKNITIIKNIQNNVTIYGNGEKIEELITNLISNAIKYIANERKITITLQKIDAVIEIKIKDTGIGISKNDLPNIFNRFYRTENSADGIKGTGLGLAICKKIVEKHNGTITAQSELNKGTTFTITFP